MDGVGTVVKVVGEHSTASTGSGDGGGWCQYGTIGTKGVGEGCGVGTGRRATRMGSCYAAMLPSQQV